KLLDRVLSRDEPEEEEEPEAPPPPPPDSEKKEEAKAEENGAEKKEETGDRAAQVPPEPPSPPTPLESRSRLAAAPEPTQELSGEATPPDARVDVEDAVPLVRRSRAPAEPQVVAVRRDRDSEEELSDGRIVLGVEDVQISDDSLMSDEERLAAEIA